VSDIWPLAGIRTGNCEHSLFELRRYRSISFISWVRVRCVKFYMCWAKVQLFYTFANA